MQYGRQSEVGKIEKLLLKHPQDGWLDGQNVASHWREPNYTSCPEYRIACGIKFIEVPDTDLTRPLLRVK